MVGLFGSLGKKSLDEVASKGDLGKMRKLLGKGADVNLPSADPRLLRRTPLHAAVAAGQGPMVEALINSGANVDIQDARGRTCLHIAVHCLQHKLIPVLLNCGADYTLRDSVGCMPIQLAIASRNLEAKEMLLGFALEHSVEFQFYDQGHWYPYDEAASRLLGFELGEGVGFAALSLGEDANYIVDFEERLQLNVLSLFMKSVSWKVLPNGKWNRPRSPFQGLHPGSQDPHRLVKYDSLLRQMASQGIRICPLYSELRSASSGVPLARPSAPTEPAGGRVALQGQQPQPYPQPQANGAYGDAPVGVSSYMPWGAAEGEGSSEPGTPLQRRRADDLQREDSERSGSSQGGVVSPSLVASAPLGHSPSLVPSPSLSQRELDSSGFSAGEGVVTMQALRSGSEEFNEVVARFMRGMEKPLRGTQVQGETGEGDMRPVTVSSVSRIKLPWERVEMFAKARGQLKGRRGVDNVRRGWHGGPKPALERILQQGFVLPPYGRNGRLFGDGVYLAAEDHARTSAEFSVPDAHGVKHVLLCVVVLGNMEQIHFDSVQRRPSNVMRFDSGTDNVESPTRYIIWEEDMNDYILPTHLLSFRYC